MKEILIFHNFDQNKVIGKVEIEEKYEQFFPDLCLAPGFLEREKGDREIIRFGLVPTENFIKAYELRYD